MISQYGDHFPLLDGLSDNLYLALSECIFYNRNKAFLFFLGREVGTVILLAAGTGLPSSAALCQTTQWSRFPAMHVLLGLSTEWNSLWKDHGNLLLLDNCTVE